MCRVVRGVPSSKCLEVLPHLVKPGGVMLITSPYTWLEQFTHPSKWMGGYHLGGALSAPIFLPFAAGCVRCPA